MLGSQNTGTNNARPEITSLSACVWHCPLLKPRDHVHISKAFISVPYLFQKLYDQRVTKLLLSQQMLGHGELSLKQDWPHISQCIMILPYSVAHPVKNGTCFL